MSAWWVVIVALSAACSTPRQYAPNDGGVDAVDVASDQSLGDGASAGGSKGTGGATQGSAGSPGVGGSDRGGSSSASGGSSGFGGLAGAAAIPGSGAAPGSGAVVGSGGATPSGGAGGRPSGNGGRGVPGSGGMVAGSGGRGAGGGMGAASGGAGGRGGGPAAASGGANGSGGRVGSGGVSASGGATGSGGATISFRALGFVTGFTTASRAEGVSGDGTVVVGVARGTGAQERGFRWTEGGGMIAVAAATGVCNHVYATNASGLIMVGDMSDATCGERQAVMWVGTSVTNLQGLVSPGRASARALDSDGSMVAGFSSNAQDNDRSVRWPNSGVPALIHPSGGDVTSEATGVSADGSIIVGTTSDSTHAFKWTAAGGSVLLPGDVGTIASAISADGNVIVGNDGAQAVRWVGTGSPVSLGAPGIASAASSDGSSIVGYAGSDAFLWTSAGGLKTVSAILTGAGVSFTGWSLSAATGISANGKVIVGYGIHNGVTEGWFVRLP